MWSCGHGNPTGDVVKANSLISRAVLVTLPVNQTLVADGHPGASS